MPPPNGTVKDAKAFSGLSGPTAGAKSQSRDQINNGNDRTPAQLVASQDFTPQMPNNPLSLLMGGPFAPFIKAGVNETRYGLSDANFDKLQTWQNADPASGGAPMGFRDMSPAQQVQLARAADMNQQLPNAYIGGGQGNLNEAQLNAMRPENISETQWAGLPMEMKSSLTQGNKGMFGPFGGSNAGLPPDFDPYGPMQFFDPVGGTRDYSGSGGTFKPITFRSGTGTAVLDGDGLSTSLSDAYSGLPALVGQGTGLMGQASTLAQQAPNEFNYNFDPQAAGQRLFNERSALLDPMFAQQRTKNLEQMQGLGRLGLQLSGEGLGAGSGMMNPDMFGVNQAQSQALSQLAAQSTQDAFGQEMQRAGLDLNQFNTNQQQQQQQYANLMGSGQGMLSAGLQAPALEQSLTGIPFTQAGMNQTQQGLDQSYALGTEQNSISRMLAQAKIDQGNVQDNGWLTGLTSLGSSFLGTSGGSGWLSSLLPKF